MTSLEVGTTDSTNNLRAIKELKSWMRHSNKNSGVNLIEFLKLDQNEFYFKAGSQEYRIRVPKDYPKSEDEMLFIDYDHLEDGYNWIANMNEYVMDKTPSFRRLLAHINSEYKKNFVTTSFIEKDDEDLDSFMEDKDLLDEQDIELMKLERELNDNLKSGSVESKLESDNSIVNNAPVLFRGNVPGAILIGELMKLMKKYNSESKIEIRPVDKNAFHWNLKFRNFSNKELDTSIKQLSEKHNYNYIELDVYFHKNLYPGYPPFIKVIRPRLENSLMHRISNLQMVQFEYWSVARSMEYVVDKLYAIINKSAVIDVESEMNSLDTNKFPNGAYHPMEEILIKLASLHDSEQTNNYELLDDTKYEKIFDPNIKSAKGGKSNYPKSKGKTHWKAGTGYSHSGTADWDYEEYIRLQQEKDTQIQSIFQKITDEMLTTSPEMMPTIYKVIESSYIIPFVKSNLQGTTILEINKHKNLYQLIFTFLQNIATEESVYLFDDKHGKTNLYGVLEELNKEALHITKISQVGDSEFAVDNDDMDLNVIAMIDVIYEMVSPCFINYMETKALETKDNHEDNDDEQDTSGNPEHQKYEETMSDHRFDMAKFIERGFTYSAEILTNKATIRRLASEYGSLSKNLPVFFGSSIFVCVDETNTRCIRALITGPEDTPYDSGIFIFDIYISDKYPDGPPQMKLVNNGKIRFNPNLYDCGKVCLSLLGTWHGGHKGEEWNTNSTLQQLLISAQAQILIEDPLYNEPGWEARQNTTKGQTESKNYNNYVRYYTMCHAMHDLIKYVDKYPEFKDVMLNHFRLKKEHILKTCEKWVSESFEISSSQQHRGKLNQTMYQDKYNELEKLINDL
jgi:ubiquitin-protein ligase